MNLDLSRLTISKHAREVIKDRDVDTALVMKTLHKPHVVEPHQGRRRFVGDNGLVCVVGGTDHEPTLVTILIRDHGEAGRWDNSHAQSKFGAERLGQTVTYDPHVTNSNAPRSPRQRRESAPVTTTRPDPEVWSAALAAANGEAKRLQTLSNGHVMIHNSSDWRKRRATV